jgi:hypothetical protein
MAVDTATRRYSMINFGMGDDIFPVPVDGSTVGDRLHSLSLYSGIEGAAPSGNEYSYYYHYRRGRSLAARLRRRMHRR